MTPPPDDLSPADSTNADRSLTDRVRSSCARVIENAKLLSIDNGAIEALASTLDIDPPVPQPSVNTQLTDAEKATATLTFALDAINFGSGYHDVVRKRPGRSGAQTMSDALTDYISWTGPLGPDRLQQFTVDDCSQIFGQELDGGALEELMSFFRMALNDLGEWLETNDGAAGVIAHANGSAEALAEHLTEMLFYRDVESYQGFPVSFYKRAQITPADLARSLRPDLFNDLHQLTAFADNLVPHTLRMLDVITLDQDLAAAIDGGLLLDPGSPAEVEIRAAGVVCVERLAALTGATAMDIDAHLWERGQDPAIKQTPRHRSRSVFY